MFGKHFMTELHPNQEVTSKKKKKSIIDWNIAQYFKATDPQG